MPRLPDPVLLPLNDVVEMVWTRLSGRHVLVPLEDLKFGGARELLVRSWDGARPFGFGFGAQTGRFAEATGEAGQREEGCVRDESALAQSIGEEAQAWRWGSIVGHETYAGKESSLFVLAADRMDGKGGGQIKETGTRKDSASSRQAESRRWIGQDVHLPVLPARQKRRRQEEGGSVIAYVRCFEDRRCCAVAQRMRSSDEGRAGPVGSIVPLLPLYALS